VSGEEGTVRREQSNKFDDVGIWKFENESADANEEVLGARNLQ